jgi:uncharacterized protein YecE (DUF72 family)
MTTYRIGTSGWHYPHWRERFYPAGLPSSEWLGFYARHFSSVEINASFYRQPSLATVRHWRDSVPASFTFAIKASRTITHMKKLRDPQKPLRALLAMAQALGPKAGPLLFQLPPRWHSNPERLAAFLRNLPTHRECVFEFRDPSWHNPQVYALLRRHNAAFCIYDLAGFEAPHALTADFAYLRLHGPSTHAYAGAYSVAALAAWANEIRGWRKLRRVYVYFDNDEAAHAVDNARQLHDLLAGPRT